MATATPELPELPHNGDDGVRVIRTARSGDGNRRWIGVAVIGVVCLATATLWNAGRESPGVLAEPALAESITTTGQGTPTERDLSTMATLPRAMRRVAAPAIPAVPADLPELPVYDPNDLTNYIKPGDPEPTMRELITALNEVGIHEGLGAFNPPGTSPPLSGLGVPDDFLLPPGYVRHHQVTDQGETIPPILMFSPDFDFVDDEGRPIAIPENRVVPPELAPEGLPIELVGVPDP